MPTPPAGRPLVLLSPAPRRLDQLFTPASLTALRQEFEVVLIDEHPDALGQRLPEAFAVIGQPPLSAADLSRATNLRVIVNVEGNFGDNVDYPGCFARGIRVLGCGPAFARPVAEFALGLALDLCRGITREDRAMRDGRGRPGPDSTADAILLHGADVGLVGFGYLGRALRELLVPFHPTIRVHDPWLPDGALHEHHVQPATLAETLATSQVLFVLATVTAASERMLGAVELDALPNGARVILVSRAAIMDTDALLDRVAAGRLRAAIDVWDVEPLPDDHRARTMDGLVLSPHRAGGIPAAFTAIGDMVLDDLRLIAVGLPPVRLQAAAPELVGRYRNRPVDAGPESD